MSDQPKARRPKCSDIPDRLILELCHEFHDGSHANPTPDEALSRLFPAKVVLAKMGKLQDRGLIEVGVSLRTGWLTDKGYEVLGIDRAQATPIDPGAFFRRIGSIRAARRGPS